MKMEVKTNEGVFSFEVDRLWSLSEIRRSAKTHFGVFSGLKGKTILSRRFVISARTFSN